jgi:cysteine desulfurase
MAANNEIGTLDPVSDEALQRARSAGVLLHSDATQLIGRLPARQALSRFDAVSLSAHKFGGLQGVGVLLARRAVRAKMVPVQLGGGQQNGLRSGTVPAALVHAMGVAIAIAEANAETEQRRLRKLTQLFIEELSRSGTSFVVRGPALEERLPGNLNLTFPGVDAMALALTLRGDIAFSLGAACQTRSPQPSHVLRALGMSDEEIEHTARLGFGWNSTEQDAVNAARMFSAAVQRLRTL